MTERKPFDPRVTNITNLALDEIMPALSGNAWKVLCFAMRKTRGWADASTESGRKESDIISLSQFTDGCGISKPTVIDAIEECTSKGYLIRRKVGQSFSYRLNVDYELPTCKETLQADIVTCKETLQVTCKESLHTNSNINNKVHGENSKEFSRERLTAEDYKTQTMKSLQAYARRHEAGELDFSWLGEGLVSLGRAFVRVCGFEYMPTKGERSLWRKVLRDWQTIGITDDIIERTVQKMRKENLPIKNPNSITGMARNMMATSTQGQGNLPPTYHADLGGLSSEEWYKQNISHK